MSTQTVPQISAEFVAAARADFRQYQATLRWMRANKWDVSRLCREDGSIAIHLTDAWNDNRSRPLVVVARAGSSVREGFYPETIGQAIDHLVTAKVLPDELHSFAPSVQQVLYDRHGGPWIRTPDGGYAYRGNGQGVSREVVECEYGALTEAGQ